MIRHIALGLYHNTKLKSLLLAAQYYRLYTRLFSREIIENAEYIQQQNHEIAALPDDDARYAYAKELLHKYAEASLVITSRIHCALPSIGLGTPTIFTYRHSDGNQSTCRYGGLKDLFNVAYIHDNGSYIETEDGKRIDYVSNPKQIPVVEGYKVYKQKLIERCRFFIKS